MDSSIDDGSSPLGGIDHIGVAVADLDEAVDLFVTRLGGVETRRGVGPNGVMKVAFVALGPVELELFERAGTDGLALDHLALRSDDLEAATQLLGSRGVDAGTEIEATRGTAAMLDRETTLGLPMHLSKH